MSEDTHPETTPLKYGEVYYIPTPNDLHLTTWRVWKDTQFDRNMLQNEVVFATEEGALSKSKTYDKKNHSYPD